MKIKWIIAAFCLFASVSGAGTIVSSQLTSSDTGFGVIQYDPGTNVSEFVIYGRASASSDYITSAGTLNIAAAINGDGTTKDDNTYTATTYSWTGGTPTSTGTHNIESCQPLSTGYGVSPYTWTSISVTCPAESFEFSFLVHDYYASVDMEVLLNSSTIGVYSNVMSSASSRDADFFYDFVFGGMQVGDELEFKFTNMRNLGSSWANIGFLSSSLDYDAPESITSQLTGMPNTIPEPSGILMTGFACVVAFFVRRRFCD